VAALLRNISTAAAILQCHCNGCFGLRRLKLDAFWLEHLPSEGNTRDDERKIYNFQRQLCAHGLGGRYCLLYHKTPDSVHDLGAIRCIGMSKGQLLDRLAGPNIQGTTPTPPHHPFSKKEAAKKKPHHM
jgi:hypothetical protein